MSIVTACSAKHSPGVTTFALALACAWASDFGPTGSSLLVEADPFGGDLAARVGLAPEPGLVSLAAAARHGDVRTDIWSHSQPLPAGGRAVLAPTESQRSVSAIETLCDRLPTLLRGSVDRAVIDIGRWWSGAATSQLIDSSDAVVLAARPDLAGIEHARVAAEAIADISDALIVVVLAGDRPYGPDDVIRSTVANECITAPVDRRAATDLCAGPPRRLSRSPLVRAARSLTQLVSAEQTVPA